MNSKLIKFFSKLTANSAASPMERKIKESLIDQAIYKASITYWIAIAGALLVYGELLYFPHDWRIHPWLLIFIIYYLFRIFIDYFYAKSDFLPKSILRYKYSLFQILPFVALGGLLWVVLFFIVLDYPLESKLLVIWTMILFLSASQARFILMPVGFLVYAITVTGPIVIWLFSLGGIYILFALGLAIYTYYSIKLTYTYFDTYFDSIFLRMKNEELLGKIESVNRNLVQVNDALETAEHIAQLGYWEIDLLTGNIFASKEFYLLHGLNPKKPSPNYDYFLKMIHVEDRSHMKKLLEKECSPNENCENEIRVKIADGTYRWFYINFRRILEEGVNLAKGVSLDITARKKAEEEITALHNQLISSAHMAGMADVATSTLHNVGNVLNSANVSVELIRENIAHSELKEIDKVINLLGEHSSHFSDYLSKDPEGKLIPEYLIELLKKVKQEYKSVTQEVDNLYTGMSHINAIILTQNEMSQTLGMSESLHLSDIIDTALKMAAVSFEQYNIQVVKEYHETPIISVNKAKLLQILINLIRNAKDALVEKLGNDEKIVTISIQDNKPTNEIIIKFQDTGIGILPENLSKIFLFGFSTKKTGHGLGLHMSFLNAKDLGGTLTVQSEGFGRGATFILTIPKLEA